MKYLWAVLPLLLSCVSMPAYGDAPVPVAHCIFSGTAAQMTGSCGRVLDQVPKFRLEPRATVANGIWRADSQPSAIWAGDMTDQGYPNAPIQLEIYGGGNGIIRSEYGWFRVTGYRTTRNSMSFMFDPSQEVPPNDLDRKIVQRAASILSDPRAWNRADTRDCLPGATAWSIYCAMEKATAEVTGGVDHRRPAMEVVRGIVDDRTASRNYHHRLMDYNNDPTTTLADVQALFSEALARMNDAAWLQRHGFGS